MIVPQYQMTDKKTNRWSFGRTIFFAMEPEDAISSEEPNVRGAAATAAPAFQLGGGGDVGEGITVAVSSDKNVLPFHCCLI